MTTGIARPRPRWAELGLLAVALGVGLAAAAARAAGQAVGASVSPSGQGSALAEALLPSLALGAAFLVVHASLVARGSRADPVLLPIVACLAGIGMALVPRLMPEITLRHWAWLMIGVAALGVTVHAPEVLVRLRRYRYTWALLAMGLVTLTLFAGRSGVGGGPRLWLGVGTFQFQPSELLKLLVVVFLAGYLEDKRELLSDAATRLGPLRLPPVPYLAPFGVMLGLALALVAAQRDLGAALLLYATALAMLFLASGRASIVAAGLAMFMGGAAVLHGVLPIVQARVSIWRDPWSDAQGVGYQVVQALMALAAGGVTGTGIGAGQPTAIPAVHNDMVYAAVAEELGLAGAAAVLMLYALLALRGFRVAIDARDPFARFLAAGLAFALALQATIIVGGVVRLIPLTGITLPFLSAGGSSILVSAVSVGLLLRVSHESTPPRSGPPDRLAQHTLRLAAACLVGIALLQAATFYWGFLRADTLAARPDNLRRIAFDQRIQRGRILDRAGKVLAATMPVPGADGTTELRRVYPVPAAAPVTGYQTWRYGAGASDDVTYGAGGAEAAYDAALRGDVGMTPWQLAAAQVLHRPQQGRDIILTLDADLQAYAADLLGDREGAIVVIDVDTGAVRALVSLPTFDPAALDAGATPGDAERAAMLNRATQGLYTPGSIWKAVTLAAALDEGLVRLDDMVDDGDREEYFEGFPVRCDNNPPEERAFDIAHAFAWSCNVTFARLGATLGAERFAEAARRFGVGEAPPFPLPVAASSLSRDDEIGLPELASAAFGQGELQVTPLHMAVIAAALAGDGSARKPYLLEDIPAVRWTRLADDRGTWRRAVPSGVAEQVRQAMVLGVTDGWASGAAVGDLTVGGKTGTAEVPDGAPHSWFIGFAPADGPRVAIAVLVAHGGEGGQVAAPLGGRILARALANEADYAALP